MSAIFYISYKLGWVRALVMTNLVRIGDYKLVVSGV